MFGRNPDPGVFHDDLYVVVVEFGSHSDTTAFWGVAYCIAKQVEQDLGDAVSIGMNQDWLLIGGKLYLETTVEHLWLNLRHDLPDDAVDVEGREVECDLTGFNS